MSYKTDLKFCESLEKRILKDLKEYSKKHEDCPNYEEILFWLITSHSCSLTDFGIKELKKELREIIKELN
jgi:hypothetical protein